MTTTETEEGASSIYHILTEDETKSLCGTIHWESLFVNNPSEVLTLQEAKQRGLQPCKRCLMFHEGDLQNHAVQQEVYLRDRAESVGRSLQVVVKKGISRVVD